MSDYITYKLWKAGAMLLVICIIAFWQGLTGRGDDDDH